MDFIGDIKQEPEKATHNKKKSRITFKELNPYYVEILRDGKRIGHIYSQLSDGMTPYPHNEKTYCLNSIQLCGFDKIEGPWACGPFEGHKDLVAFFRPTDDEYYNSKKIPYNEYVSKYIADDKKDIRELLSFQDWISTIGAF